MSLFDDILAADAAFFTSPDLMPGVESIAFTPRGGSERIVNAQVFRDVPDDTGGLVSIKTKVFVARVDVPTISKGGDVIRIADQRGELKERRIVSIVANDAGGYELTLE